MRPPVFRSEACSDPTKWDRDQSHQSNQAVKIPASLREVKAPSDGLGLRFGFARFPCVLHATKTR